jgi:hypothetical protein
MVLVLKILIENTVISIITNSPHFVGGTDTHQLFTYVIATFSDKQNKNDQKENKPKVYLIFCFLKTVVLP